MERSLGRIGGGTPTAADLLGGQSWLADAAATVLVVANFERCSWKYQHPTAFRVTLIAAGHAAQNVLLAAHDLAATPTCAVTDRLAEELLGLDSVKQTVVHGIALGPRAEQASPADPLIVERVLTGRSQEGREALLGQLGGPRPSGFDLGCRTLPWATCLHQ